MRDTGTEPCLWASDHGVDIEEPVLGDGMGAAKEWSWSANFSAVRGSLVFFFFFHLCMYLWSVYPVWKSDSIVAPPICRLLFREFSPIEEHGDCFQSSVVVFRAIRRETPSLPAFLSRFLKKVSMLNGMAS